LTNHPPPATYSIVLNYGDADAEEEEEEVEAVATKTETVSRSGAKSSQAFDAENTTSA
jgi:hypothetical protein